MFNKIFAALLVVQLLLPAVGEAVTSPESSQVSWLLMQSRMSHEPESVIKKAVLILDRQLDEDSRNMTAWRQLAEALSIGLVHAKHANSSTEAWRHIYELDSSDCHSGALATPFGKNETTEKIEWIRKLNQAHPQCAEALYLNALISKEGSDERIALLRSSQSILTSSDALILIAQELLVKGEHQESEKLYSQSFSAPPLFPEDWRPDGRGAVHAHLGLAWSLYSRKKTSAAKLEYKAFLDWFNEPGPWHDLSEAEINWQTILDGKFYKSVMKNK
jgi:tetratricopeptide (TPR) repeat protein